MESNFESFWKEYPKKSGKGAGRTSYEKQEQAHGDARDFYETVVSSIAVQKRFRKQQQSNSQFVAPWKNPTTWLNQECWTDEMMLNDKPKMVAGSQCLKCTNPSMGERFNFCEEHEAWQTGKTLVKEMTDKYNELHETCKTTEQWRDKYRELAKMGIGNVTQTTTR